MQTTRSKRMGMKGKKFNCSDLSKGFASAPLGSVYSPNSTQHTHCTATNQTA